MVIKCLDHHAMALTTRSKAGSDPEILEDPDNEGDGLPLQISKEDQAFLEATFGSRLEFATRKAKLAKYGMPDSIWLKCPELCSVVAATLSKDAVKEDKVSFRAQQMWLDVAVPLTACLEKAHGGELTVADPICSNADGGCIPAPFITEKKAANATF